MKTEHKKTFLPISFNESYRNYVSDNVINQKNKKIAFSKESNLHPPNYLTVPIHTFSSIVENSHQNPRGGINFIKPYSYQNIYKNDFHKNFLNEPIWVGSKKYTRATLPNRMEPEWN